MLDEVAVRFVSDGIALPLASDATTETNETVPAVPVPVSAMKPVTAAAFTTPWLTVVVSVLTVEL